jgi:hypothetical protein
MVTKSRLVYASRVDEGPGVLVTDEEQELGVAVHVRGVVFGPVAVLGRVRFFFFLFYQPGKRKGDRTVGGAVFFVRHRKFIDLVQ